MRTENNSSAETARNPASETTASRSKDTNQWVAKFDRSWESSATKYLKTGLTSHTWAGDVHSARSLRKLASYSTNSSRQCHHCLKTIKTWFSTRQPSTVIVAVHNSTHPHANNRCNCLHCSPTNEWPQPSQRQTNGTTDWYIKAYIY